MTTYTTHRKLALGFLIALMVAVLFVPTSVFAYRALDTRVNDYTIWDSVFVDNQSKHGFPAATRDHIRQGMYQWDSDNTGADFEVSEGTNDDSYVQAIRFSVYGYPNISARTTHQYRSGEIRFSAINLNREWSWDDTSCATDDNDEEADVRVVATHEAGHLIRLSHDPLHTEAVMWPDGTCKLTTVADDDAGVVHLYGDY